MACVAGDVCRMRIHSSDCQDTNRNPLTPDLITCQMPQILLIRAADFSISRAPCHLAKSDIAMRAHATARIKWRLCAFSLTCPQEKRAACNRHWRGVKLFLSPGLPGARMAHPFFLQIAANISNIRTGPCGARRPGLRAGGSRSRYFSILSA